MVLLYTGKLGRGKIGESWAFCQNILHQYTENVFGIYMIYHCLKVLEALVYIQPLTR